MSTPNTPQTPKEEAVVLMNSYAAKKAGLNEVIAPLQRQIAELTATVETAKAPHMAELEAIEERLKQLALKHGPAIFGEARSLVSNGIILQVRGTDSVQVDDEDAAIRELSRLAAIADNPEAKLAYEACLRVTTILDKEYITKISAKHADWLELFGIRMVEKESASVRVKPPVKPKATTVEKPKRKGKTATPETPLQEAA